MAQCRNLMQYKVAGAKPAPSHARAAAATAGAMRQPRGQRNVSSWHRAEHISSRQYGQPQHGDSDEVHAAPGSDAARWPRVRGKGAGTLGMSEAELRADAAHASHSHSVA